MGAATVDRLEELQLTQLYAMPFENFDIQLGKETVPAGAP